jgi:AraC-like DNA-binding protein
MPRNDVVVVACAHAPATPELRPSSRFHDVVASNARFDAHVRVDDDGVARRRGSGSRCNVQGNRGDRRERRHGGRAVIRIAQQNRLEPLASPLGDQDQARRGAPVRYRHWRMSLRPIGSPCPVAERASELRCISFALGPLQVAQATLGSGGFVRDARALAGSPHHASILAMLVLRGSLRGSVGETAIDLTPGDIGLIDLRHRGTVESKDCAVLSVLVPRKLLKPSVHGLVLRASQLPCRMLTRHLQRLVMSLPVIDPTRIAGLVQAALAVLELCVEFTPASKSSHAIGSLRDTVLACIDEHLEDPVLTPDWLAARLHVSRSLLYRTFSGYGGIHRCIRDKRLDAAFRDLQDNPHQRVIDIAYRWGFSSERQFQRAFHARFQMTPSAAKADVPL